MIKAVRAVGYQVVVEVLTYQEVSGTKLSIGTGDSNQGYVIDVGQMVDPKFGVAVGNHVMFQGNPIIVPNPRDNGRKWAIMEMNTIKAVLEE